MDFTTLLQTVDGQSVSGENSTDSGLQELQYLSTTTTDLMQEICLKKLQNIKLQRSAHHLQFTGS